MTSELEEGAEPKDRTKLIWGFVLALICVMLAAIWWAGKLEPNTSVVRLKHILISYDASNPSDEARARDLIRSLRERILNGESFSKLAEEYSNDPGSARRGGDLGYLEMGSLAEPMEVFAWTAPIGQLSDVIKTQFGYHLAIVTDRRLSDVDRLRMKEDQEWQRRISGQSGNGSGASESTSASQGGQ